MCELIFPVISGVQVIDRCHCLSPLFSRSLLKKTWLCQRSFSWFWTSLRKLRWEVADSLRVTADWHLHRFHTKYVCLFVLYSQNLFGKMSNILEKIKKWVYMHGLFLVGEKWCSTFLFNLVCVCVCVCVCAVCSYGFSQSWPRSCMLDCGWPSSPPACCRTNFWDSL